jgi:hypothetical protein
VLPSESAQVIDIEDIFSLIPKGIPLRGMAFIREAARIRHTL